ncbi:MAG: hypothetical protein Q7J25_13720, partial [Vicinamibacterales bacterium]|nr:hypothetical protein [Vicinamibacterales bacterium]
MSDATTSSGQPTVKRVAWAVFYGFLGGSLISKALVTWLFDGPDWVRALVWTAIFVAYVAMDLLLTDGAPPRRTYRRLLAERGLEHPYDPSSPASSNNTVAPGTP